MYFADSHTTDDLYFMWSSQRKSMDILENAHLPDFEILRITTHDCTATYATGMILQQYIKFYTPL